MFMRLETHSLLEACHLYDLGKYYFAFFSWTPIIFLGWENCGIREFRCVNKFYWYKIKMSRTVFRWLIGMSFWGNRLEMYFVSSVDVQWFILEIMVISTHFKDDFWTVLYSISSTKQLVCSQWGRRAFKDKFS